MFITNVSTDDLPAELVWACYRLRWQILWPVVSTLLQDEQRPLSWFKAYKTLIMEKMDEIQEIILRNPDY